MLHWHALYPVMARVERGCCVQEQRVREIDGAARLLKAGFLLVRVDRNALPVVNHTGLFTAPDIDMMESPLSILRSRYGFRAF